MDISVWSRIFGFSAMGSHRCHFLNTPTVYFYRPLRHKLIQRYSLHHSYCPYQKYGNEKVERHSSGPKCHSNEKNPNPTIIAIPAVKIRGDHLPQGLAATCAEEIGADDISDPGANVTLEKYLPREDGTPANVKFEKFSAAVVACIVCCTPIDRPPLMFACA